MMDRRLLFLCTLGLASLARAETLRVPLDYSDPKAGTGEIYYELGAPYDKAKPLLFYIADGQQFAIRKGRMKEIQRSFGPEFNVLGIVGRAEAPDMIKAATQSDGGFDWIKAWRYYRSAQWVEDIERVRRQVAGPNGKILLYGSSGGAMLSHEYMARYGRFVSRCLTPAATMPWIEAELNLSAPAMWPQLSPKLRDDLQRALALHQSDRVVIATVFQRQHFFVSADQLPQARADLIEALAAADQVQLAKARKDYQVDAILAFLKTSVALPIRVREYEFMAAGDRLTPPSADEFDPDMEAQYDDALPLVELCRQGKIERPSIDLPQLHKLDSDVLILAGVHDEAVDFRGSISLAARYPNGHILILNDNHVLSAFYSSPIGNRLQRAFLLHGYKSSEFSAVLGAAKPMIWNENANR